MGKAAIVCAQQKWEHFCLIRRTAAFLVDEANKLGQAGWEMVSVLYGKDAKGEMAWTAFLKRPAASAVPPAGGNIGEASQEEPLQRDEPKTDQRVKGFDLDGEEFEIMKEAEKKSGPVVPPPAKTD